MPFRRFDQARPFATLGIVVLVWLLLPTAIKTFTRASFSSLTAPMTIGASYVRDVQEWWALRLHSKDDIIKAGAELARANAFYQSAIQRNAELQAEIERLESLLRLPSFADYRYEHARVARRDFSAWWQRIVIRKGSNYGIPLEAPVIFTGGVVGKVVEVGAYTAVVELISSQNVRFAGAVEDDSAGRPIWFQGGVNSSFGPASAVVENVPLDIILRTDASKRLVTSGYGGVFPPGLTLGTIVKLELGTDGLFQSGIVRLDERLGSLNEVTVLVPLHPQ